MSAKRIVLGGTVGGLVGLAVARLAEGPWGNDWELRGAGLVAYLMTAVVAILAGYGGIAAVDLRALLHMPRRRGASQVALTTICAEGLAFAIRRASPFSLNLSVFDAGSAKFGDLPYALLPFIGIAVGMTTSLAALDVPSRRAAPGAQ